MKHIHYKSYDYLDKIRNFEFSELNIDYVLNTLKDRYRWPLTYSNKNCPSVEIIDGDHKKTHFFDGDDYINSEKIISLYKEGYTLILSICQSLSEELREINKILSIEFDVKDVHMNLYMSKGLKTVSFCPHSHNYDVLVKNVCGKSEWILGKKNIIFESNDIINIPKNVIHGVTKIYSPKLSITCNLF